MEVLKAQTLIAGNAALAAKIANAGDLEEHGKGDVLFEQGEYGNDLLLILSGSVVVTVNGRDVAERSAGTHIGELALADPLARRSATVTCADQVVVLRIPEHRFSAVADKCPDLWRRALVEVAHRLKERNKHLREPNSDSVVFIGSSGEAVPDAQNIHKGLQITGIIPRIWSDGVFEASKTTIETLVGLCASADFAVLVLSADDVTISKRRRTHAPRDNIIFELGLFIGALGRERVFIVSPKDHNVKIPTDMLGVTRLEFLTGGKPRRFCSVCKELRRIIRLLGPR